MDRMWAEPGSGNGNVLSEMGIRLVVVLSRTVSYHRISSHIIASRLIISLRPHSPSRSNNNNSYHRRERRRVERPTDLKHVVGKYASRFIGYQQHDAHEFLRFFVDGLHEDLNRVRDKPAYEEIKDVEGEDEGDRSQRWWDHFCRRNDSRVKDIFGGQLRSEVTCKECGNKSVAYDPIFDISVPIPKSGKKRERQNKARSRYSYSYVSEDSSSNNNGTRPSVTDCLAEFAREEEIPDSYVCPKCKCVTPVSKRMAVVRCPSVLVLHVKVSFNRTSPVRAREEQRERRGRAEQHNRNRNRKEQRKKAHKNSSLAEQRFSSGAYRRKKLTDSLVIDAEIDLSRFCHTESPVQPVPKVCPFCLSVFLSLFL